MFNRFPIVFFVLLRAAAAAVSSPDIYFEPNLGQASARVQFVARVPAASLAFAPEGVRIDAAGANLLLRFAGAARSMRFEPLDPAPDRTSYFLGRDASRWIRNVPHYRRLAWRGIYPGIDVVFYSSGG